MNPDWNWFFSSTAQSAAAIAGIFGAFIITKIVSNISAYSSKCKEIESLIQYSIKLVDQGHNIPFGYFNKIVMENQLARIRNVIREEGKYEEPEYYYEKLDVPQFAPREEIINLITEKIVELKTLDMNWGHYGFHETSADLRLANVIPRINTYIDDVNHQSRVIRGVLNGVVSHPESSKLLTFSIFAVIVLFFIGVIYPLSFLPSTIGVPIELSFMAFFDILFSFRGAILFSISFVFVIFMSVFLVVNLKLRYNDSYIRTLEKFSQHINYSEYLKNAEQYFESRTINQAEA